MPEDIAQDLYRNRDFIPDFDALLAETAARSRALAAHVEMRTNIAYGPRPRERMDLLSRELSEARLFRNGGRLQHAKERAQRVLASAQQLASLPFQARSEWELSRIESASGDPYAAYHHAVAAAALGIRGGDFLTAAAAFTDLMYLSQVSQRSGMVERWQQFAEATLARVVGSTAMTPLHRSPPGSSRSSSSATMSTRSS